MKKIYLSNYKNIVILTGAGISVASGIRPFRGKNGIWDDPKYQQKSKLSFLDNPKEVWSFWSSFRPLFKKAVPSKAHLHLSYLEKQLSEERNFLLATQNIDGLHTKAGSKKLIELHGNLMKTKCCNSKCAFKVVENDYAVHTEVPICNVCGNPLRPEIILFGEYLGESEYLVKRALRECDLFIAIGTSGVVSPAASFVRGADYSGARTIYMNIDEMNPTNPYFHESIIGDCENTVIEYLCL